MGAFFSFSDIRIFAQMIFHIYDHCLANQTHLHMKGCAPELVFKSNSTRIWLIQFLKTLKRGN